jgi:hypothetical protein
MGSPAWAALPRQRADGPRRLDHGGAVPPAGPAGVAGEAAGGPYFTGVRSVEGDGEGVLTRHYYLVFAQTQALFTQ